MSTNKVEIRVANLDCEHEAAAIERGFKDFSGVFKLKVYPKSAKVAVDFDPEIMPLDTIKNHLVSLGFPIVEGGEHAALPQWYRNPKVVTSLTSGILLLTGWLLGLASVSPNVSIILYITAMVIGGYYFGREAVEKLLFERKISIEFLMSAAAITAAILGELMEGAMLVFLYSISEAAEGYTEERTRSAIKALMKLTPKTVLVKRDEGEMDIPVEELGVNDVFYIKPGQSIATDGVVISGESSVDQSPITGESVPVDKKPGDQVFAGSINGSGYLEVRASKIFSENTISRIIHMVEEAQEKKGKSQRFIERFGNTYSPLVLLAGLLVAVAPPLFFNAAWVTWITRATVFIVAAAPCALVISIPITMVAALGAGARRGILMKGGIHLENLSLVRVLAFDKTGTLTSGRPEVTDVLVCAPDIGHDSRSIIAVAAGIEKQSEHPIGSAIVTRAAKDGIAPREVQDFTSMSGFGASAKIENDTVYIGNTELFHSRLGASLSCVLDDVKRLEEEGKTVVLVGDQKSPWGIVAVRDNLRDNAAAAISSLHRVGVKKTVMLTGDNEATARAIAHGAGIDEVYANLKPEEKLKRIETLSSQYEHVAMVGDGVNDAPALAAATVGIAMGAMGTDVAIETADIALMADDLEAVAYAVRLARRTRTVVKQNLGLSAIVIGALIIGAIAGIFTLPVAVLAHEVSEFVVIGSGLRMLRG
ncbi:MAG TPA: cation-translocating P-type ATPase [Spirochaetota bacterium]|nr:cation-translocating P-type ATPase [Spirochaetota bacterium]